MGRRGIKGNRPKATSVCLPLENWPLSDKVLWDRANDAGDGLDDGGFACSWSAPTKVKYARDYGRFLAWLARTDPEALLLAPLARLTKPRVQAYIAYMRGRPLAPYSVACFLAGLGSIAWAFSEGPDYIWITRAAKRLAYRATPSRNKQQRIRPSYEIADFDFHLMREAETANIPPLNVAVKFRNGLLIAMLAYRPIRRGNVSGIRIGQHLSKGENGYQLRFAKHETKQRNAIEIDVPQSLTAAVNRYLEVFRPVLLAAPPCNGSAGDAFWVAMDGGALSADGVYQMVVKATRAKFGESLNPHIFRDCAATTIATDDPANAAAIAGVLGHSSMVTSERHYNQARSIDASRRYQGVLAALRRGGAGRL